MLSKRGLFVGGSLVEFTPFVDPAVGLGNVGPFFDPEAELGRLSPLVKPVKFPVIRVCSVFVDSVCAESDSFTPSVTNFLSSYQ
jgi:hypothetical protein